MTWVEVIRGNHLHMNGFAIENRTPKIMNAEIKVVIEEEDIVSELKY